MSKTTQEHIHAIVDLARENAQLELQYELAKKFIEDLRNEHAAERERMDQVITDQLHSIDVRNDRIVHLEKSRAAYVQRMDDAIERASEYHNKLRAYEKASGTGPMFIGLLMNINIMDDIFGPDLYKFILQQRKIDAIKIVRKVLHAGLKDCKDFVEALAENLTFCDCYECSARNINPIDHECPPVQGPEQAEPANDNGSNPYPDPFEIGPLSA